MYIFIYDIIWKICDEDRTIFTIPFEGLRLQLFGNVSIKFSDASDFVFLPVFIFLLFSATESSSSAVRFVPRLSA